MRSKDNHHLYFFLLGAITQAKKKLDFTIKLSEAETLAGKHKDSVLSWMQWQGDGKKWFSGTTKDRETAYTLKEQYRDMPTSEIIKELKQRYDN